MGSSTTVVDDQIALSDSYWQRLAVAWCLCRDFNRFSAKKNH
jgi:hypothetical protein